MPGAGSLPGGDERQGSLVGRQEERRHLQVSGPAAARPEAGEPPPRRSPRPTQVGGGGERSTAGPLWTRGAAATPCTLSLRLLVAPTVSPAPPSPMPLSSLIVQLLSQVRLSVTPGTAARQASLSSTISRSLLKLMSIELVMPSNHLILCRPLLLPPLIFSTHRVFYFYPLSRPFASGGQSIGVSASASVLPMNIQN